MECKARNKTRHYFELKKNARALLKHAKPAELCARLPNVDFEN
jgi:hypothetical protein